MSLSATAKISTSTAFLERAKASIRNTAQGHFADDSQSSKALASAASIDPATVLAPFLVALVTNSVVSGAACPECGYSDCDDATIDWVIENAWQTVAGCMYPEQG